MDALKALSGAAVHDDRVDLSNYKVFARHGRTNIQEQQQEKLREAHRIFDIQVTSVAAPPTHDVTVCLVSHVSAQPPHMRHAAHWDCTRFITWQFGIS